MYPQGLVSDIAINQRDAHYDMSSYDQKYPQAHGIQISHNTDFSKKDKSLQNYDAPHYQTHAYRNEPETPLSLHHQTPS